jgi:hypothetical protein
MVKKQVAVIIPFYKESISAYEAIALEQCYKVLSGYPIIAIKPARLTLPPEVQKYLFTEIISFDNDFFKSVGGYNALMLSDQFYKAFLGYEYILIHQLDAFVFRDDLSYWCEQNYDYIGAPWLKHGDHPDLIKTVKSAIQYYFHIRYNIYKNGEPSKYQYENKVGNGGFSLRRVKRFYELCLKLRPKIDSYLKQSSHHFNEDRFWAIEVNRKRKVLNIPEYKTGVKFSIESMPERAWRLNNNQLPFGCHAWDRYVYFWKPIFTEYNYFI